MTNSEMNDDEFHEFCKKIDKEAYDLLGERYSKGRETSYMKTQEQIIKITQFRKEKKTNELSYPVPVTLTVFRKIQGDDEEESAVGLGTLQIKYYPENDAYEII